MIIQEKPPLDEALLAHYGVKGMHWGIRKKRETSDRQTSSTAMVPAATKSEKKTYFGLTGKQIAIGATILVGVGVAAVVLKKSGALQMTDLAKGRHESTLSTGAEKIERILTKHADKPEMTFPMGQSFSRISKVAETELRNGTYATYTPKDVAAYKAFWPGGHHIDIKALGEIRAPDLKTRFDTMTELIDKKQDFTGGKTYRQYLAGKQRTRAARAWVRKASAAELAKHQYAELAGGSWGRGIGPVYLDALRKKGFSAMFDDTDSTNGLSDAAMVLINKNMFEITSNNKLSKLQLDQAYADYKRLLSS